MTIIQSPPSDLVRFKLEFRKPFEATNTAEFTFAPQGDQTAVTWSMSGRNNFMCKAVGLFVNCDKMIGGDFEKGLADLKSLSESGGHAESTDARIVIVVEIGAALAEGWFCASAIRRTYGRSSPANASPCRQRRKSESAETRMAIGSPE